MLGTFARAGHAGMEELVWIPEVTITATVHVGMKADIARNNARLPHHSARSVDEQSNVKPV